MDIKTMLDVIREDLDDLCPLDESGRKVLRDFNRADWTGLAGAECTDDGRSPRISYAMRVSDWPDEWYEFNGVRHIAGPNCGNELCISVDAWGIALMGYELYLSYDHDGNFDYGCDYAEALLNLEPPPTVRDLVTKYHFTIDIGLDCLGDDYDLGDGPQKVPVRDYTPDVVVIGDIPDYIVEQVLGDVSLQDQIAHDPALRDPPRGNVWLRLATPDYW